MLPQLVIYDGANRSNYKTMTRFFFLALEFDFRIKNFLEGFIEINRIENFIRTRLVGFGGSMVAMSRTEAMSLIHQILLTFLAEKISPNPFRNEGNGTKPQ